MEGVGDKLALTYLLIGFVFWLGTFLLFVMSGQGRTRDGLVYPKEYRLGAALASVYGLFWLPILVLGLLFLLIIAMWRMVKRFVWGKPKQIGAEPKPQLKK